jgi:very-short-patch-repair endonuclease
MRPDESLGVIALGIQHARRIETALASVRRDRPDLDGFFSETVDEPFFIKNLERVQGDERDAIIFSLGYGRTRTGAVSHNFGPINREGGERRLNVAIMRAKERLVLVSTFRKADLNPSALRSRGAQLLAAYLGYAESAGADLGRDGVDLSIPSNPFEVDIQRALEARLKTGILPQYGVGQFRIDLAVQHPDEPGRFVLAVECDGATYHSTPTARMRDRLRQSILENLGWRFVRIWSTDWFNDRESELQRVSAAFQEALAGEFSLPRHAPLNAISFESTPARKGPSPARPPYRSIADVSDAVLAQLLAWIESDQRLRTDDELVTEMMLELGFHRRGTRIVERIAGAVEAARRGRR